MPLTDEAADEANEYSLDTNALSAALGEVAQLLLHVDTLLRSFDPSFRIELHVIGKNLLIAVHEVC